MSGQEVVVRAIALPKPAAAAALGMSTDSFDRHVAPHVRCIRRGRMRLYPVAELERWCDEQAEATLPMLVAERTVGADPNNRPRDRTRLELAQARGHGTRNRGPDAGQP